MKVLLIAANTERINMVSLPLGLGLVAAATRRAGHQVSLLDLLTARDPRAAVRQAIAGAAPEVLGISVRNIDDQNRQDPQFLLAKVKDVVAECRACSRASIVLGGAGYSMFPRETLEYLGADLGVRGDGEAAFPALLDCMERGGDPRSIPGVQVAGEAAEVDLAVVEDPGSLPLWDEAISALGGAVGGGLWFPIQTRRGCPNDCTYCATARIQGRVTRCLSPEAAAQTLAHLARRGFERFFFVDNSFNIPETHAHELCRRIRELGLHISWRCILYPHLVSEDLVATMAGVGCAEVSMGFESGCARILAELGKRFLPGEVRALSDSLARAGIRRMGFLLLGGPGETRESVEESLEFAEFLGLDGLKVTVGIRIYPGTPLADRALAEGLVAPGENLLAPRFYLAPGLEPWIHERVAAFEAAPAGTPSGGGR